MLKRIMSAADAAKSDSVKHNTVNHKNALHAVLFEAFDLVIHLDE
jgi:hypothetical protein